MAASAGSKPKTNSKKGGARGCGINRVQWRCDEGRRAECRGSAEAEAEVEAGIGERVRKRRRMGKRRASEKVSGKAGEVQTHEHTQTQV